VAGASNLAVIKATPGGLSEDATTWHQNNSLWCGAHCQQLAVRRLSADSAQ